MVPGFVLSFGGVFIGVNFGGQMHGTVWRWPLIVATAAGFIGVFLATTLTRYRCPRCEKVPHGSEGVLMNPVKCPTCDLPLK
jgi:hypothetical protein